MFDIHLPNKSIHGVWEFFLHLFTITVGLLIAVQIESCVDWRHHVHLAEEARAALREEIQKNLKDLKDAQPGLKAQRQSCEANLAVMRSIQENPRDPKVKDESLQLTASEITLRDTAWKTAQSTGALAYMPYEEAEWYSNIYQAQTALMAIEGKPREDLAQILGLVERFNLRSNSHKISADEAGTLAEKLGVIRLHLASEETLSQSSIEQCEAFLENRKARESFSYSLN
jgi:hypothetical protein